MPFLLERLAARPAMPDGRREAFDESAAIAAQIQRIFYTRHRPNDSASLIDWGLPNIVELGNRDMAALSQYAEQARQAIQAHEPRLKQVTVNIVPQNDALISTALVVTGVLAKNGQDWQMNLPLPD